MAELGQGEPADGTQAGVRARSRLKLRLGGGAEPGSLAGVWQQLHPEPKHLCPN